MITQMILEQWFLVSYQRKLFYTTTFRQPVSLTSLESSSAVSLSWSFLVALHKKKKKKGDTSKRNLCDAPPLQKSLMFVSHLRRRGIVTSVVLAGCPPAKGGP